MKVVVKYIKQALFDHNCVIIPDFGGFLTEYKPADINSITFDFSPPTIDLTFNSSLQKDDGLLKSEISLGESLNLKEAELLIKEFVREIKLALEGNNYHKINGLGEFKTIEGNIIYVPSNIENLNKESYGLPKFTFDPIDRNTEDMKRVRPVPPARRVVKRKPVENTEKIEEQNKTSSTPEGNTATSTDETVATAPVQTKVEKKIKAKKEEPVKEKNKKSLFVVLPVLLVLVAVGITGFLYQKNGGFGAHNSELIVDTDHESGTKTNEAGIPGTGAHDDHTEASEEDHSSSVTSSDDIETSTSEESHDIVDETSNDETSNDEHHESSTEDTHSDDAHLTTEEDHLSEDISSEDNNSDITHVTEEEEDNIPTVTNDNTSHIGSGYNIIIGSFAVRSNAENVVAKNPGSAIVNYNGLNCVSVGTFSDKSEAQNVFSQKRSQYSDVWLVNIR